MTQSTTPKFLFVVPCYREGARLESFLEALCGEVANAGFEMRIQIVEDGSEPAEQERLRKIVEKQRSAFDFLEPALLLPQNLGKGGAIYAGWERHLKSDVPSPDWLGFADADGATSAKEICRMVDEILRQPDRADVWLASRVKMLGREVDRTLKRHIMGRVYATLATLTTGLAIYDSQCGCKFLKAGQFLAVRDQLRDMRFGFDMELLAWMYHNGARMVEFPVDWWDVPGSKVHLVRDTWRMFTSLLRLGWRLRGTSKSQITS